MKQFQTLENYLQTRATDDFIQSAVATTILCIAAAAIRIANLVARGLLASELGRARGDNTDGDVQKKLDLIANDLGLRINELAIGWNGPAFGFIGMHEAIPDHRLR